MNDQNHNLLIQPLEDGIIKLVFNASGSVNTLNQATLTELDKAISDIEQQPSLNGLIISSNKDSFIVGADVTEFMHYFALDDKALARWIDHTNQLFNRIEDLPFPTLTVIRGFALGGGCECALATDFRIGDASAQLGFPETKLGIIPGLGGTVRLPRLIGADNALQWIASATQHNATESMKTGLLDAIVETEHLQQAAINMLRDAKQQRLDWQQRRAIKQAPLTLSATERAMCFESAKALVASKAPPKHYPASWHAVLTVEEAADAKREQALAIETAHFVKLAKTPQAKALVTVFLNDQLLKRQYKNLMAAQPAAAAPQQMGVVGAGVMGGAIAYQAASKGLNVPLKDIAQPALDLAQQEINQHLQRGLAKGKLDTTAMAVILGRINNTLDYSALRSADFVIEAVIEDPAVKVQVLGELEQQLSQDAIITTNTSTISIDQLAAKMQHPERFCGMHFFNPVQRMPLVEVIRGSATSDSTVQHVVSAALALGKTPIIVKDCPGFFVNRVLFPYLLAFLQLLQEGVDLETIDRVMEQDYGWPMGPAHLADMVGLDIALHAGHIMQQGYPDRMGQVDTRLLTALVKAKRLGQKTGRGFYRYTTDKKGVVHKQRDPELQPLLNEYCASAIAMDEQTIIDRLMIPMTNEVLRCLHEGIVDSPAAADIALLMGLGFPAFRGGLAYYVDSIGLPAYIEHANAFVEYGGLYQVDEDMSIPSFVEQAS